MAVKDSKVFATTAEPVTVLSDGRKVVVRQLKGKDLLQAQVICQGNPQALTLAMTAMGCSISGVQAIYEDLLEEDAFIVMELMALVMSGKAENFPSVTPGVLSITGTSQGQA
jgi:hypothetical protein